MLFMMIYTYFAALNHFGLSAKWQGNSSIRAYIALVYRMPDVSNNKEPLIRSHIDKSWKLVLSNVQFSMTNSMRHTM